jgi:acyl-CoA thioester hydrolase
MSNEPMCDILCRFLREESLRMATEASNGQGFGWNVRVYYEDTDAGGVVYHARYLQFMERARTEWLRALGFEQDLLREQHGVLFTVRRAGLEFIRPARFNDLLSVTTRVTRCGRASLDFAQAISRTEDGTLCCRGAINVACVEAVAMRPTRIPEEILSAMPLETADGR